MEVIAENLILRLTRDVSTLTERFAHVLVEQKLLPAGKPVVVAVSGGLDSMVLLHLLNAVKSRFKWTLHVAHFNHRLRGAASSADERFVRGQAGKLGLPFHSARWEPMEKAKFVKKHGVEMAAREARLRFLGATARAVKSKNVVLAHHADDQAELFFIRILRGASSNGLGGMQAKVQMRAPVSCALIRPLLAFSRKDLTAWAKPNQVRYREDASNQDFSHLRNRIRHQLIPLLESEYSTGILTTLSRTMRILADEAEWWRAEAGRALNNPSLEFSALPVPLQRHVIVIQLEQLDVDLDFETVERLRGTTEMMTNVRGDRLLARNDCGQIIEHSNQGLDFEPDICRIELKGGQGRAMFGSLDFSWKIQARSARSAVGRVSDCELFDADRLGGGVTLRFWRPGDRFQPIGMKQAVKLQDLFTNAKIPAADRRRCVLAESEAGDVVWVEGLRIGDHAKVTATTRKFLVWQWGKSVSNG